MTADPSSRDIKGMLEKHFVFNLVVTKGREVISGAFTYFSLLDVDEHNKAHHKFRRTGHKHA